MTPATLHDYQQPHAQTLLLDLNTNGSALDASDTGTGKMYVAVWLAKTLGLVPLVVAPASTLAEWQRVAAAFGVELEVVSYERARGIRKKFLAGPPLCEANGKPLHGPHFIRLSASEWGREIPRGSGSAWLWHQNYDFVIFDEVHRCSGSTSLNSKLLIATKRQAELLLAASATAADDPRQLKALGYALGLFTLGAYRWWLLNHGCEPGLWGGYDLSEDPEVVRGAMARIHRDIFNQGRGARMRKETIPGFPKTRVAARLIPDTTGKARHLAKRVALLYEGRHHLPQLTAVRAALELLRVPALADLAEDYALTSKVVIFVNYKATIAALRRILEPKFACRIPSIDGDNTPTERERIKFAFQHNMTPVLLCNNQAGGVGIGLHDPSGSVERTSLISPCYSARDMQQVLGRVQRQGGGFSQQFFVYFADTIEAEIAAVVDRKLTNLDALNDANLNGVFP